MKTSTLHGDLRARLSLLDSCAISDALDSLGLPPAVVGLAPLSVVKPICGPVMTVKLIAVPAGDSLAPAGGSLAGRSVSKPQHSPRHLCTAAIESAARGDVIVIEHSSGVECAGWGGVLSVGAQVNGVEGVVIDGPARDIDEARALGFPVYGRSPIARTARGRAYEIDFNCEIRIGEVRVVPGDVVFADSSGVVFLPAAQIEEIVRRAARIAERERLMVQALRAGDRITEVVGRNYEEMLTMLD
jgi:4-hydroxy-4-methyl-2-oxoglutarate aldolase